MKFDFQRCPACQSPSLQRDVHREVIKNFLDVKNQTLLLSLCKSCGFVFQNPVLESMQSLDHYVNHSSYVLESTKQMLLAKEDQFDWIRKSATDCGFLDLLKSNHRAAGLFEIGASVGALLNIAKGHGWSVSGVEPAVEAVNFSKSNYGIVLQQGGLEDLKKISEPMITLVHVFEHLAEPIKVLERIFEISEDNAFLAIEVPDISLPRNTGGTGFFIAEHVNYFTANSLVQCAVKAGWQIAGIEIHEYKDAPEFCMYPVLRGTFIKRTEKGIVQQTQNAVKLISNTLDQQSQVLKEKLKSFIAKHGKVVVFGAGWHTAMLLDLMNAAEKSAIVTILDSNPERWGTKLQEIPVSSAAALDNYRGMGFIVSSQGYQDQIVEQIRKQLKQECSILTFY